MYNCKKNCLKPSNHKPPPKNKKFCFKDLKNNTFKSLHEVEYFLNNFDKAVKCIKLYKIFK